MALDFSDRREWYFYDLPVRTKHLYAWRGERLRSLHTSNGTPDSSTIGSDDLDVFFSVERL